MNDTKYLSDIITKHLEGGTDVVLASIVEMEGSSPRHSGSKMVVIPGGKFFGTIGGSLLEASAILESANVLTAGKSKLIEMDMTGSDTSAPDMICGGKTRILLDYIGASEENINLFSQLSELIDDGDSFYLVTAYTGEGEKLEVTGHCLLFSGGEIFNNTITDTDALEAIHEELHKMSSLTELVIENTTYVIDPIRRVTTVYMFGAGHVAAPTAHIAAMTGFSVVVVDDREEFANMDRFPDAEQIVVIDDYTKAFEQFDIDEDSFIVIVTRGHRYDREVLEQAIQTRAGYIGMISSKRKRDTVYERLISDGVTTAEELKKVYSPIGLPIGGETPEEIAVSIVGEMISVRGKKD